MLGVTNCTRLPRESDNRTETNLTHMCLLFSGFGDMAVSNGLGSNVFDILMCLGVPWLLDSAIIKKGDPVIISSGGIAYSALILLSTVAFMILAINFIAKWKLDKPFGILCLLVYLVVITISTLFELNVFGDFVLPSCPRT